MKLFFRSIPFYNSFPYDRTSRPWPVPRTMPWRWSLRASVAPWICDASRRCNENWTMPSMTWAWPPLCAWIISHPRTAILNELRGSLVLSFKIWIQLDLFLNGGFNSDLKEDAVMDNLEKLGAARKWPECQAKVRKEFCLWWSWLA